jgi:predicted ATPase
MSIKRIALKNFKCFKEVDISFSKITLLTGENSSGKSSLIYGILAPLQSVDKYSSTFPLHLSLNGKYVNMGGFEELVFNHILSNQVGIELTIVYKNEKHNLNSNRNFRTFWYFDTISKSPKLDHLSVIDPYFKTEIKKEENLSYVEEYQAIGPHGFERPRIIDKSSFDSNNYYSDVSKDIYKKLDELEYHSTYLNDIYRELLEEFNFISSFRLHPERTYYQSIKSDKVDKFGGGYIDQILEWNDSQSKEIYDFISILKDLKMLYKIKAHRLAGGRFELKVKVKSRSKWESLADVGFGVSQFLPIIVADLQLSNNSTLVISQPEIHLHPSVQANIGDYLVKQVKERNKNYIVETHSEYLLNRMRLLIVKEEIQPKDVAVYYFENSVKDGSIAHRIEFTKDGQILNAPKGFFETYMIDTMDIALNA